MPDIFLRSGEANPNDVVLTDPTSAGGAASVVAVTALVTAQAFAPDVFVGVTVDAPVATVTSVALVPSIANGSAVSAAVATATAEAYPPIVSTATAEAMGGGGLAYIYNAGTVRAPAASVLVVGHAPAISAGASASPNVGRQFSESEVPEIGAGATLEAQPVRLRVVASNPQMSAGANVCAPRAELRWRRVAAPKKVYRLPEGKGKVWKVK